MQAYLKYGFLLTLMLFFSAPNTVKAAYPVPIDSVSNVCYPPKKEKTNKLAVWSLILAGAGLILLYIPYISVLAPYLLVGGVVTGIIALNQSKKRNQKGKGLAIASLIIGGVSILLIIAALIYILTLFK